MNASVWQLDPAKYLGTWHSKELSTQVVLDRPQAGWQALRWANEPLVDFSPGEIRLGAGDDAAPLAPASMHVRGCDLIATYPPTKTRDFTTQIYRRVGQFPIEGQSLPLLSTMISLNTHLLDAQPVLWASSRFAAGSEALIAGEEDFAMADLECASRGVVSTALLRPADSPWSYLELWHSIDFQSFERTADRWQVQFSEPLEKGVIRRLLIWGALLPRDNDLDLARSARLLFSETAPPLTT